MAKPTKLAPIHFVELFNTGFLQKWLSNPIAKRQWNDSVEDVIFDDEELYTNDVKQALKKVATQPSSFNDVDPIALGKVAKSYLEYVINQWVEDSNEDSAKLMVASLPLFIEMSKSFPHINPDDYETAFRGTEIPTAKVLRFIKKHNDPKDWKRVTVGGHTYMAYVGPKKNYFTYTPHRQVQSWSVSDKAASSFGSSLIATPIDKTFFFDPSFMGEVGMITSEKETVHFGKQPMKVILLLDKEDYDNAFMTPADKKKKNDPANATFESDYEQYMANQYTGGDKLLWQIDEWLSDHGYNDWYLKNKGKILKDKKSLGKLGFEKKYTEYFKKLKDVYLSGTSLSKVKMFHVKENAKDGSVATTDIQDDNGTLSMPL